MISAETVSLTLKEKAVAFLWQHLLLTVSLFVMTLGVALCVRSAMGSSVISAIPFVMTLAGESRMAPALSIGQYTYLMNILLVALQVAVLRRRFQPVQLFQLLIGFLFGALLDVNIWLTGSLECHTPVSGMAVQLAGCVILAAGIALEIRCGSVTMPGEGLPAAISKAWGMPFAKAKIMVDITLVVIAVVLGYAYFGSWQWQVVGAGTLVAMVLVGALVKFFHPRTAWFDRMLHYRPGFRRYIYGLARYIYRS